MTFYEYLRTNGIAAEIDLENWNIQYNDNIEMVLKVNRVINNWPELLRSATSIQNYFLQFNYYSGRSVINVYRGGNYSGDSGYYSLGARNFNYYIKITVVDGVVNYYSGTDVDNINTLDSSNAIGPTTEAQSGTAVLFKTNNNLGDISLYYIKVTRNDELIHHYMVTDEGIRDIVEEITFPYNTENYIFGPEIEPPTPPTPPARYFNITLYRNYSEKNRVGKNLEEVVTLSGTLKDECSIIDPVIMIEADPVQIGGTNYLYIPVFGRYYFIQNFVIVRTNLIRLECHVDVLESFADGIKACSAIISKQENLWNLYINDGTFKTYQNPMVLTKPFPQGFNTWEFVLGVAGSDIQNEPEQEGGNTP